jgi:sulfatase modifying factor 1
MPSMKTIRVKRLTLSVWKKPYALDLFNRTGNLWEWTGDLYVETFYRESPRNDPRGPEEGTNGVLRCGCWLDRTQDIRSTQRFSFPHQTGFHSIGFRLVKPVGN